MQNDIDEKYMRLAIEEAKVAKAAGDWPFGTVIVKNGVVVGKGHVTEKTGGDITDHSELRAIKDVCRNLKTNNLGDCDIYCTNEPCAMCSAGIFQAKIARVVVGASREDLSHLLRHRNIGITDLANDSGYKIEIATNILKSEVLKLFKDIKKD